MSVHGRSADTETHLHSVLWTRSYADVVHRRYGLLLWTDVSEPWTRGAARRCSRYLSGTVNFKFLAFFYVARSSDLKHIVITHYATSWDFFVLILLLPPIFRWSFICTFRFLLDHPVYLSDVSVLVSTTCSSSWEKSQVSKRNSHHKICHVMYRLVWHCTVFYELRLRATFNFLLVFFWQTRSWASRRFTIFGNICVSSRHMHFMYAFFSVS